MSNLDKGDSIMLIEKTGLKNSLNKKVILLTGAGGGIGFEVAKAFAYMGANVIIAEIDKAKGMNAEKNINELIGNKLVEFYEVDLSDESKVHQMVDYVVEKYGCPDITFNNATVTKFGTIEEVAIEFWDNSYAVNLKAPLIFIQRFLPMMKERGDGILVFVSSSGAAPYMGAYEIFKTAQVELANTLAMELEGSNIYSYTIGPGLVKTETAMRGIEIVASKMGISTNEFYSMNEQHILDVESAGVGFALSVIKAGLYHGQEIGSIQTLMDFNLIENTREENKITTSDENIKREMKNYISKILSTYEQQYHGWKSMNIFEKQWVLRDFKKYMGLSAEQAYDKVKVINTKVQNGDCTVISVERVFLEKLKGYWEHQLKQLQGYEKNRLKLEENTKIMKGWSSDIDKILILSVPRL